MDRASGSGVFARDPDALIDMIELELPLPSREELIHRAIREVCLTWIKMCVKDWEERISQDDMCSHVALQATCSSLLSPQTLAVMRKELEEKQDAAKRKTGWRIEGILREFKPLSPRYVWFDYPIHVSDESEMLKSLFASGERKNDPKRAQESRKSSAAQKG